MSDFHMQPPQMGQESLGGGPGGPGGMPNQFMHPGAMPVGMMPPMGGMGGQGMNMPMPFQMPPFMQGGNVPFGMQMPQKTNEMIISNVHSFLTDQMVYQLLDKYNPRYVTRKFSRAAKIYFRVGFNQPKDAEAVERDFKYKIYWGHYMKVLWATKTFPEISNSIVLKNIKEGMNPTMIDEILSQNGFKVYVIHFPTSLVESTLEGEAKYKPNGYAFVQFKQREATDKTPEDAIRLLDGYAFPAVPDVQLIAQKFDPSVKEKKKERDVLYCTGFPAELAEKSEGEITKYLVTEALEGLITKEEDVSIRVYKKTGTTYATMKFNESSTATKVYQNFIPENEGQENTGLIVRYIKSRTEISKEYKDGEMHKKCIFVKNIKMEITIEEFTKVVSELEGYTKVVFFKQNEALCRKCAAVAFNSDKEAQEAISKIKLLPEYKNIELPRGPGDSAAPSVTILFTKTQKAKWDAMKKSSQMVRNNNFGGMPFGGGRGGMPMMPPGPQMGGMMGPMGGPGFGGPPSFGRPPQNRYRGPGGPPFQGGMQGGMGGPGMQMGPRPGFQPGMRGQGGPYRGGPRHFGGGHPPHYQQHHQQPEPQVVAPPTWEEELMNLQGKLKNNLMAQLKASCVEKDINEVRSMVASEVIRVFASYFNRRSDSDEVKRSMLQFLNHIESAEDLDILLSDVNEWKESMDFIWSDIFGEKKDENAEK